MRPVAVLLGLASLVLAGVALGAGASGPIATCGSIVVPGGTYEWKPRRVVLGVAAVPPRHIPQTVPSGSRRWPYWSKSGVVVRADSQPVEVSVPPAWRGRAAIEWGDAGPSSSILFASCPASGPLGGWNPYTGGFHLRTRAACVPLTFRVGERKATVRFGVGKRCG